MRPASRSYFAVVVLGFCVRAVASGLMIESVFRLVLLKSLMAVQHSAIKVNHNSVYYIALRTPPAAHNFQMSINRLLPTG